MAMSASRPRENIPSREKTRSAPLASRCNCLARQLCHRVAGAVPRRLARRRDGTATTQIERFLFLESYFSLRLKRLSISPHAEEARIRKTHPTHTFYLRSNRFIVNKIVFRVLAGPSILAGENSFDYANEAIIGHVEFSKYL